MTGEAAATLIPGYCTGAGWQDEQGLARVSQGFAKRLRAEIKKLQVHRALKQGHQEVKICHYLPVWTARGGWMFSHRNTRECLKKRRYDQLSIAGMCSLIKTCDSSSLNCPSFVTTEHVFLQHCSHQHLTTFAARSFHEEIRSEVLFSALSYVLFSITSAAMDANRSHLKIEASLLIWHDNGSIDSKQM